MTNKQLYEYLQKPEDPAERYNRFLWEQRHVVEEFERNKQSMGAVQAMQNALRSIGK